MMKWRFLPIVGIVVSGALLVLAALNYPGGNEWNTAETGFRITKNYVSALFQPNAINGAPNSARIFAVPAMLVLCTSLAFMFWAISKQGQSQVVRKSIEIGGIGSMVYTLLGVLTRMHDLLVVIAAIFFGVAAIGMIYSLHKAQRLRSGLIGLVCFGLLLALGAMRHANFFPNLAPITEWSLFALTAVWVLFAYAASAPNNSFKPTPPCGAA